MKIIACLVVLALFNGPLLAVGQASKRGTYVITRGNSKFVIELIPAAKGAYTVKGTIAGLGDGKTYSISGTLSSSGVLRAKYRVPGSGNEQERLDGRWDAKAGAIILTSMDGNALPAE